MQIKEEGTLLCSGARAYRNRTSRFSFVGEMNKNTKSRYFRRQSTAQLLQLVEPQAPLNKSKDEWINEVVGSFDRAALIGGGEATLPETAKVRQHAMDFGFLEALSKNFERVSQEKFLVSPAVDNELKWKSKMLCYMLAGSLA